MTYTTLRGKVQTTRPMKDIPMPERKQILIDLETMPSAEVRAKYNVSNLVLSHIRWHHSGMLQGVRTPQVRVRELRRLGLNSEEVAAELGIPLKTVNALW